MGWSTNWNSLLGSISRFKGKDFLSCVDNSVSNSSLSVADLFAGWEGLGVGNVVGDDWLLNGVDHIIRFGLDHLNSLDLIWLLLIPLNMFDANWLLWDVVNMRNSNRLNRDVLNMLSGKWLLRNVLYVRNGVSWILYPFDVLNCIGRRLNIFDLFNWVWLWNVSLIVWHGIWLLGNIFNVRNFVRRWLNVLNKLFWDGLWHNSLNVSDGDWLWLDPFNMLHRNIFNSSDLIRLLGDHLSPLNIIRLGLEPFGVGDWVARWLYPFGVGHWNWLGLNPIVGLNLIRLWLNPSGMGYGVGGILNP